MTNITNKHLPGVHNQKEHGHGSRQSARRSEILDDDDIGTDATIAPVSITPGQPGLSVGQYLANQLSSSADLTPANRTKMQKVTAFLKKNKGKIITAGAALAGIGLLGAAASTPKGKEILDNLTSRSTRGLNDEESRNLHELEELDGGKVFTPEAINRTVKDRGVVGVAKDAADVVADTTAGVLREGRKGLFGRNAPQPEQPKDLPEWKFGKQDKPLTPKRDAEPTEPARIPADVAKVLTPEQLAKINQDRLDQVNAGSKHTTPPDKQSSKRGRGKKKSLVAQQDDYLVIKSLVDEVTTVVNDSSLNRSPYYDDLTKSAKILITQKSTPKRYVYKSAIAADSKLLE